MLSRVETHLDTAAIPSVTPPSASKGDHTGLIIPLPAYAAMGTAIHQPEGGARRQQPGDIPESNGAAAPICAPSGSEPLGAFHRLGPSIPARAARECRPGSAFCRFAADAG